MPNWPIKKLGEVCELYQPKTISKAEMVATGQYKVYGANGIIGKYDKYNHEQSEILVTCRGATCGTVNVSEPKSWINGNAMVVCPKSEKEISKEYLYYLLRGGVDMSATISGSAQPQITRTTLYPIEIPLPPIGEQKKIVAKLERVLAKIGEAKKIRAEARKNADNLLSAELYKIFSQQDSYSLIRANKGIVKKWEEKELKEIVEQKTSRNTKGDLPFVGMEDVESETGRFLGSSEPRAVRSTTFYFNDSCVLYGKLRPYLNKVLLPDFEGHCSTEFIPLKPKNGVSREWIAYWLKSPQIVESAMSTNTGSRMPRANMKDLMKFKIPLPPLAEQKKIVARLDSLSEKIGKIKNLQSQAVADFKTLEQSILHQAFSN